MGKVNAYRVPYRANKYNQIDFYKAFQKPIASLNDPTHRGGFCVYAEVSVEDLKKCSSKCYSSDPILSVHICNRITAKKTGYIRESDVPEKGIIYIYWYFIGDPGLMGERIFKTVFEDTYTSHINIETSAESESFNRVETPFELEDEPLR